MLLKQANTPLTPVLQKTAPQATLAKKFLTPVQKTAAPRPLLLANHVTPTQSVTSFQTYLNESFPKGPVNKTVAGMIQSSARAEISPISSLRNRVCNILSKNLKPEEKLQELKEYQAKMELSLRSNLSLLGETAAVGKRKRTEDETEVNKVENAAKRRAI
jgi:hypothetical protein